MLEFLKGIVMNPMFWVIVAGLAITLLLGAFSKTRKIVYAAVIWAEQNYLGKGRGDEKRLAVVLLVRNIIPVPLRWVASEWLIGWLIEAAVSALKDWLDDGNLNGSVPSGVLLWLGEIYAKLDMDAEGADERIENSGEPLG